MENFDRDELLEVCKFVNIFPHQNFVPYGNFAMNKIVIARGSQPEDASQNVIVVPKTTHIATMHKYASFLVLHSTINLRRCLNASVSNVEKEWSIGHMDFRKEMDPRVERQLK